VGGGTHARAPAEFFVGDKNAMLYAPSHFWSCHFPAVASILIIGLYALFGLPATLLVVPFLLLYPLFLYRTFRRSAVSILVDDGRFFVRKGLEPEKEYSLRDTTSFVVSRNTFYMITQLKVLEWFLFNPKEPVRMIMITADGKEILLFSYIHASPLKCSWSKFAVKLENLTGKCIYIKEISEIPNLSLKRDREKP
jgi:hypothetical protein